jgi:hypothetical protein
MEVVLPLPARSVELRWMWSVWRRRKRAHARASRYLRLSITYQQGIADDGLTCAV